MQELGRALHYLADINTPHHAALLTTLNSNHAAFERFVDSTRLDYCVDTTDKYSGLATADSSRDLKGYSQEIFNLSAWHALEYKNQATSTSVGDMQIAATALSLIHISPLLPGSPGQPGKSGALAYCTEAGPTVGVISNLW